MAVIRVGIEETVAAEENQLPGRVLIFIIIIVIIIIIIIIINCYNYNYYNNC